jgi:hypothetical protein
MTAMARFDLAPVDPDIEPFVRKSAGGSRYSHKGNMLWTEQTSDQAQGEAILSHELSHFFVHVGTPYGSLIEALGKLQERLVLEYCATLAEKGLPIRYPVYRLAQRDDAPVDPALVAQYVRPWSRLVHLERILDGSNVRAVRDATIPDAVELLADLEDLERAVLVAGGVDPANLGERPSFARMLDDARDRLAFAPACPRFQPTDREESVAGGAALFEGLAQAAERMVYPDHWDTLARGMSRDQYLGFYTITFMKYGTDRIRSQQDFDRAFDTFVALCDLALQTPIGSSYGKLRPPDCDYGELHPGYRFIWLLDNLTDDDWIDSLDDLPGLQATMSARLHWPDPRLFQVHGSEADERDAHSEAMRMRLGEPTFHLFLQDSASAFLSEYGPLVRDPRTGEIMPSLKGQGKLDTVINYIMWRLTWQVMMGPRLDVDEALPGGIYEGRWWENIDTKEDLANLFFEAVPALSPERFVLT